MSATDAKDALARLGKLRLTRKQEPEIARVLIRAVQAEPVYNPYYALLAKILLKDQKRYKMSFHIALWKYFEQLGEKADDEDGDEEYDDSDGVGLDEIANVSRMYAFLLIKGSLQLDVLKTLNIGFTKEKAAIFLELCLIEVLRALATQEIKLVELFSAVPDSMCTSLRFCLHKTIRHTDLVTDKREKKSIKQACNMAQAALEALSRQADGIDSDD